VEAYTIRRTPEHVDLGVELRLAGGSPDVHLSGQMEDQLRPALPEEPAHRPDITDVALPQLHAVRHVGAETGRKVVERRDLVPVREQSVGQVRADEPRPTGDKYPRHDAS
jgi:hypothetical protein